MKILSVRRIVPVLACLAMAGMPVFGAATLILINNDPAGVGMNDPTIVAQVGGNTGTTLGQQRLNAVQYALNIWGATLTSAVPIRVQVNFSALSCTATAATTLSAGTQTVHADFPNAPVTGAWYPQALANKLAGVDLDPGTHDIFMRANVNLGQANCLTGTFFYLGVDNNHGTNIDLVTTVLHELAHGLGFNTFTNVSTGNFFASGFPSAYDRFLFDVTANKSWDQMTAAERVASAINTGNLVWTGANLTSAANSVLNVGAPQVVISAPAGIAGTYLAGPASFGSPVTASPLTGDVMPISTNGCTALSGANALAVNGNIALIDLGGCAFVVKVKNAQNAGAIAVLLADNAAGSPPAGLNGSDPTITIPSVRITQADGLTLKNQLRFRSRTKSGVIASLQSSVGRQGVDSLGRVLMYAPNPVVSGLSVNHFDLSAFPDLLMEPRIEGNVTHSVTAPFDLTFALLQDLGW